MIVITTGQFHHSAFVIGVSEVLDKDELSCNCVGGSCYLLVTPLTNKHGRETVYYQITDVDDTGPATSLNIVVRPTNDPPVIVPFDDDLIARFILWALI